MDYKQQIAAYLPVNEQERSDKGIIYRYMQEHPHNIHTRDNAIAHLTSSGFIMNRDLTKVLVIYHRIYQAWGWTGGHSDGEKDLLAVSVKEAKEETGLKNLEPLSKNIMSLDILPVWGHTKNGEYVSAHLHLNAAYVLIADEDDLLQVNHDETEGVKWIDADSIEENCDEPELVVVYKKLIEAAKKYDPSLEIIPDSALEGTVDGGFARAIADTSIPIAVHEAKSAYYKAKLVKEVTTRTGKAVVKGTKNIISRFKNK